MLLRVRNLRVDFRAGRRGFVPAVRHLGFDLPEKTTLALVGESGSGKSVTALSLMGLLPQGVARLGEDSEIVWQGRDLLRGGEDDWRALRGREMAMIFQEPMTSLNPVFPVGAQLMEGLRLHMGLSRQAARDRAAELLDLVGIPEPRRRLDAYPHELSGGQQQRVMIAMAISTHPRLLIADEPTTALDVTIQRQIMELLMKLQQDMGMSMLFITHDLALVSALATQVVVMRHGELREAGPLRQVFDSPHDLYTRALLACRPRMGERPQRLPVIEDFMRDAAAAVLPQPQRMPVPPGGEVILKAQGLGKHYVIREGLWKKRVFPAVQDVSLEVTRGRTLGVVGESGSGKTTLGLMLAGILRPDQGTVKTGTGAHGVQIVFQNPYASLNPRFTVAHILMEPLLLHGVGATRQEQEARARELLDQVGLPREAMGRYPHEFSGGQRQRIAIARCLALRPEVLVCDESVSALDVSVQAQVLNLLRDLQDEFHMSYVFISHDLAVVHHMADDILVMQQGQVVETGPVDRIFLEPQHPYTRRLLDAVPGRR